MMLARRCTVPSAWFTVPSAWFTVTLLLAPLGPPGASAAQDKPPPPGFVTTVGAPDATCAAVNDVLALLAIGHDRDDFQLSLTPLDDRGVPRSGAPLRLVLPRPEKLAAHRNYASGVAFHPTLPILYVWQDVRGSPGGDRRTDPAYTDFEHLLIFEIKAGEPRPLRALARGAHFAYNQPTGLIGVTPRGDRLFLPNLREPASNQPCVGAIELDPAGVPMMHEGTLRLVRANVATANQTLPTGWGFLCASENAVIMAGQAGVLTWDVDNRLGMLNMVSIPGAAKHNLIGGHPAVPAVFGAAHAGNVVFRVMQSDGYLTMQPAVTTLTLGGIRSPPVIIPGQPVRMALGGVNALQLITLDAGLVPQAASAQVFAVDNPAVRAVAWSDRFKRLYVGVETPAAAAAAREPGR